MTRIQQAPLTLLQTILIVTAPIFVFGPQFVTPDTPLFLFWSMILWAYLRLDQNQDSPKWTVVLGILLGLAALSKYTAVLAGFALVGCRLGWRRLVVIASVSGALVLPNLLWGVGNQAGILFQLRHGFGDGWGGRHWNNVYDLWLIQFFFWSPVTFLLSLAAPFLKGDKVIERRHKWALFLFAMVPMVFFSISALQKRAEGNWPLVGVLSALVLQCLLVRSPRGLWVGIGSNVLTCAVGASLVLAPSSWAPLFETRLPHIANQLKRPSRLHEFTAWGQLHQDLVASVKDDQMPVLVKSYQNLSEMLFFDRLAGEQSLGARLRYSVQGSRVSQFNFLDAYLPSSETRYWLLDNESPDEKPECPVVKILSKGKTQPRLFRLMRCER